MHLGGDCLWTGCVPSKALVASAHAAQLRRDAGRLGILGKARPVDLAEVMTSMRAARDVVARHDDPARFRALGVEVITGPAEFSDPHTIRVGDRTLTARRIVIATGSLPSVPAIPGLEAAGYHTHRTIFDLERAPASLAVIGGGPVGVELAQVFQRLGVAVVLLEMRAEILGGEDPAAAAVVRQALVADGVTLHTGATVLRVEPAAAGSTVIFQTGDGAEARVVVDSILVATGRQPNIADLGLDRIGVRTGRGGIEVSPRLATSVRGIWAAGDVTGGPQFTHVADAQARLVVRNALTPFKARWEGRAVPRVTYSEPELAQVGPTQAEAEQVQGKVRVWRYDFAELDRAIVDRRPEGFVKLVATRRGRMLGATIVGAGAGNLIVSAVLAIRRGLTVGDLAGFIYPYPTMSEGILRAATMSRRAALDSPGGRLLRWIVRLGL